MVSEPLQKHVEKSFGIERDKEKSAVRCPGMDCSDFRKAAGATWKEKAEEACSQCNRCKGNFPIEPSNQPDAPDETDRTAEFISRIVWIRQRRQSGFQLDESKITNLEYEALLRFDFYTEQAERETAVKSMMMLEQNLLFSQSLAKAMANVK